MEGLIMALQFLLALAIIVGLHEWGHMFAAKRFGMRVEKYFIFMPPKLFGKKIGETEYCIGSIPLGGFVKISGMIDESMDKEQMKLPPQPWEFRSKPAWQRMIVMLGGIIVNLITGIIIFIALAAYKGESYIPIENTPHGIYAGELAQKIGLQTGDKIINVNGEKVTEFEQIYSSNAFLDTDSYYTIERNGETIKISIPNDFIEELSELKGRSSFITPLTTFEVGSVGEGSNAEKAGLLAGDKIIKIGRRDVLYFETFSDDKLAYKGKVVPLKILRNGKEKTLNIEVDTNGVLGFMRNSYDLYSTREYTIAQAIPVGFKNATSIIIDSFKGFGKIGRGEVSASKAISGPFEMAQMFGSTFNGIRFWTMCGIISMALGFMNLLPIPALDGGHVMFLTYEIIVGKKPPEKFMEYAQMAGMIILLGLMLFTIFNGAYKTFM